MLKDTENPLYPEPSPEETVKIEDLLSLRQELESLLSTCLVKDQYIIQDHIQRLFPARNLIKVQKVLQHLIGQAHRSQKKYEHRQQKRCSLSYTYPEELPISQKVDSIRATLQEKNIFILSGATGSGKTTQIPKICLEAGLANTGKIICTQPRRLAARSIARRLAQELKTNYGQLIGCKIRFTDNTSPETLLKVVTDGVLLAEIQSDPLLLEYSTIIIDEAHERSLNIDFLLGYIHQLLPKRPDLKVIITSATLDTEKFSKRFHDAPILEVSGRTYPVDIQYCPLDPKLETNGDFTYLDAAAKSLANILHTTPFSSPSDVLVFLPTERDIRELKNLLTANTSPYKKTFSSTDILPLFGRLSASDQDRIFSSSTKRKIVLSTNIAETSLTIPNIRYVIDTGLARMSRYSVHSHTLRLPIEAVSQSSADQRAGRCGRIAPGICIRLYNESDYLERPKFTSPEILRSNLATVILRMKYINIGDIHSFPFLDAPSTRSINSGLQELVELGALDSEKLELTSLGKKLAQIPIDPSIGRMLLQAFEENVLKEVLIIASALSIQDPRERPFEEAAKADSAHRQFLYPESDFLIFLNIWTTFHNPCEKFSQNQLRKFCKSHYLSYTRMREWRDIHQQLVEILTELKSYKISQNTLAAQDLYAPIHRSLMAGLPSNIAHKIKGNNYLATHSRKVKLFPGSGLFDKNQKKTDFYKKKTSETANKDVSKTPSWILCARFTDTAELYAITAAKLDPQWIKKVASHLLKFTYTEPHYDEEKGSVLVKEKIFLHGLLIDVHSVAYALHNPEDAKNIFIQCGLVADTIRDQIPFLLYNREIRKKIEDLQTRQRLHASTYALEERLFNFYAKIIPPGVGSVGDLFKFSRLLPLNSEKHTALFLNEKDLITSAEEEGLLAQAGLFPEKILLENKVFPLVYNYQPGQEDDGVTLKLTIAEFEKLNPSSVDWLVPGYLEEKINLLIRSLPKNIRTELFPIAETARSFKQTIEHSPLVHTQNQTLPLHQVLKNLIKTLKPSLDIQVSDFDTEQIPSYLMTRLEVIAGEDKEKGQVIAKGRHYSEIKKVVQIFVTETQKKSANNKGNFLPEDKQQAQKLWDTARSKYERAGIQEWNFATHPLFYEIGTIVGVVIKAYPGLMWDHQTKDFKLLLFSSYNEALNSTEKAHISFCTNHLKPELAWVLKDLNHLDKLNLLYITFGNLAYFKAHALENIVEYLFEDEAFCVLPLEELKFFNLIEKARLKVRGIVPKLEELLQKILENRRELTLYKKPYPKLIEDLNNLLPNNFLQKISFKQLTHIPRYLTAMKVRCEKFASNPQKDKQNENLIIRYQDQYLKWITTPNLTSESTKKAQAFYWLLQEYKVSIFAQHLGTHQKVSPSRLNSVIEEIQNLNL